MTDTFDPTTAASAQPDPLRDGAAVFLAEVLDMSGSAEQLAADLSVIKRDANAAIHTIQLDSSVGPAAFLVYTYVLDARGGEGKTGRELFETGLATLQQAAERETPGPRAVAHAEDGNLAFILATTPGTYRALVGGGNPSPIEATPADLIPVDDANRMRGELAQALMHSLKEANEQASTWLRTIQLASQAPAPDDAMDDLLEFNDDETALALYLLDDQSIGDLLRVLNLLVTTAQERASSNLRHS